MRAAELLPLREGEIMGARKQRTNPLIDHKVIDFHKCILELEMAGAWHLASEFRKILLQFMKEARMARDSSAVRQQ